MRAESGAMAAMSADVAIAAQMEGGVMRSLKRSVLGGESLFVTTYTAGQQGGWVDVAANLPGDLLTLPVYPGQEWNLSKGSWLASEHGVTIDTKWGGFGNLMGGEGGFLVRATPARAASYSRVTAPWTCTGSVPASGSSSTPGTSSPTPTAST